MSVGRTCWTASGSFANFDISTMSTWADSQASDGAIGLTAGVSAAAKALLRVTDGMMGVGGSQSIDGG